VKKAKKPISGYTIDQPDAVLSVVSGAMNQMLICGERPLQTYEE